MNHECNIHLIVTHRLVHDARLPAMSDSTDNPITKRRGLFGALGNYFAQGYNEGAVAPAKGSEMAGPQLDRRTLMQSMAAMMGQAGMPMNAGKMLLPEGTAPAEIIKALVGDMEVLSRLPFKSAILKMDSHGGFFTPEAAKSFSESVYEVAQSLARLSAYRDYYPQVEEVFLRDHTNYHD